MGLRGSKSLRRKVHRMRRKLDRNVERAVASGATSTAAEAKAQVLTGNQVWTGNLVASIYTRKEPAPSGVDTRYRIVADTPYAAYVEFGTGSRFGVSPYGVPDDIPRFSAPPMTPGLVSAITKWVMTKPGFFGTRDIATAWGIAESIQERGTHAHPYMRPAWFATKPELLRKVRSAMRKAVRHS